MNVTCLVPQTEQRSWTVVNMTLNKCNVIHNKTKKKTLFTLIRWMKQNSKDLLESRASLASPNMFNLMKRSSRSFLDQWEVNLRLMAQPSTNEQKLSRSLTASLSWIQQHIFSDIKSFLSPHCVAITAVIDRVTHMSIVKIQCVGVCVPTQSISSEVKSIHTFSLIHWSIDFPAKS